MRQLCSKRARHGAWRLATGLVLRRPVAGFRSAVDTVWREIKARAVGETTGIKQGMDANARFVLDAFIDRMFLGATLVDGAW